jgi:tRNA 2-thiouridine synthesizing protein A
VTIVHLEVDARGLMCPLPLLRLKMALKEMAPGEVVRVLTTDPAAHLDLGVFIEQAGHQRIAFDVEGDVSVFIIRK